jgi:hypothetical protein
VRATTSGVYSEQRAGSQFSLIRPHAPHAQHVRACTACWNAQSTHTSLYHRCFSVLSPRISATRCAPACGGLLYIARAMSCSRKQKAFAVSRLVLAALVLVAAIVAAVHLPCTVAATLCPLLHMSPRRGPGTFYICQCPLPDAHLHLRLDCFGLCRVCSCQGECSDALPIKPHVLHTEELAFSVCLRIRQRSCIHPTAYHALLSRMGSL